MTTVSDKLLLRAQEYQAKADALRLAAAELNGTQTKAKQAQLHGALDAAIKLRAKQTNGNGNGNGHKPAPQRDRGQDTPRRREILLKLLKQGPQKMLALTGALHKAGVHIQRDRVRQFMYERLPEARYEGTGPNGWWVLKGMKVPKASPKMPSSRVRAQREATAALLAKFTTDTPRSSPGARSVGVLVQHGYLKPQGDGYVRTAKPFSVELP